MYLYQADVWCDGCAGRIMEGLQQPGDWPWDSGDYPVWGPDYDEADSPCHCGAGSGCLEAVEADDGSMVGAIVSGLTPDGVKYVMGAILDGGRCARLWADHYDLPLPCYGGTWDRFDIVEAFSMLAHDYGLYGVADRIATGFGRYPSPQGGKLADASPEVLAIYARHRGRASRTGPWDRRLAP